MTNRQFYKHVSIVGYVVLLWQLDRLNVQTTVGFSGNSVVLFTALLVLFSTYNWYSEVVREKSLASTIETIKLIQRQRKTIVNKRKPAKKRAAKG